MVIPPRTQNAIGEPLRLALGAATRASGLLRHPAGHPLEQLEDALNVLQEASWDARRALGAERGRIQEANRREVK